MKLTDEEYEYLKEYEPRFHQAVRADYVSAPNPSAIREMHRIWCRIIGRKEILRESCYHCVLTLVKEVGKVFFDDKREKKRIAADKAKAEAEIKPTNETKEDKGATTAPTPKKAVKGKKTSKNKK